MKGDIMMRQWTRRVALMLALVPAAGLADGVAKRESVERLPELTNADSILDMVYSQMGQVMQGLAQQLENQTSERELFDRHEERLLERLRGEMSWEHRKGPMTEVYLEHYTEKELADRIALYESETGRSMVEKRPAVRADSMAISQSMVEEFLPKLRELSEELQRELTDRRLSSEPEE